MPARSKRRQPYPPLERSFYNRHVVDVAQELLGKQLIRQTATGLFRGTIVEVEAYLSSEDSACHAARGKTKRNAAMFGPPGHAYVYAIHSRWCFNVVTEAENTPSAVLIRALEPLEGLEDMQELRKTEKRLELARGPGRLCEALAINRSMDGWDLTKGETLWIAVPPQDSQTPAETSNLPISVTPRIGVTSAHHLPLRFFYKGNPYVSGPKYWHNA